MWAQSEPRITTAEWEEKERLLLPLAGSPSMVSRRGSCDLFQVPHPFIRFFLASLKGIYENLDSA